MLETYHLLLEFAAKGLQPKCPRILELVGRVEVEEAFSHVDEEGECELAVDVLASHTEHCQLVLVDVVEQVVSELVGLVGLGLDLLHQVEIGRASCRERV